MLELSSSLHNPSPLFPRNGTDASSADADDKHTLIQKRKRQPSYKPVNKRIGKYFSQVTLFSEGKDLYGEHKSHVVSHSGPDLKTALIHMMSHELRTPFSVIQSSAELLLMMQKGLGNSPEEQVMSGTAQNILQEISRVTELLNRMVLFSKLEAGSLRRDAECIDPLAITRQVMAESFAPYKDGRTAGLTFTGEFRMPTMDPVLYTLVLRNLLDNALKYSEGKSAPLVRLTFLKGKWGLSVKDFGIGIPAKDLPQLTTPFTRGDNTGEIPGTGLGLTIVQYIVNSFNGSLSIHSAEGKGTTMTAIFPG